MTREAWMFAAGAALLGACNDDLPKISLVSEMDIFGLSVAVQGEPGRATPKPGETADVALALVYPEPGPHDDELSIAVLECTYPERFVGAPVCQEFIDATDSSGDGELPGGIDMEQALRCDQTLTLPAGPLTLRCLRGTSAFELPIESDNESARRLLLGVVCRNGVATLGGDGGSGLPGFHCEPIDGAAGELEEEVFNGTVVVQQDEQSRNESPSLDETSVTLDDAPWPPSNGVPSEDDCGDLPTVQADQDVEIGVSLPSSAREEVDGEPETLRIAHRANAGKFERSSSYIPGDRDLNDEGEVAATVTWTAPKDEDSGDRLVEFHFSVRDGRGGFTATRRYACLP